MAKKKTTLNKIAFGAVVVLAPGGMLLGLAYLANRYRQRAKEQDAE